MLKINWYGYYLENDGYGRYGSRFFNALYKMGVDAQRYEIYDDKSKLRKDALTISFMPPYMLEDVPGKHWLYTMTEGSLIPQEWVTIINNSHIEKVVVPCYHNQQAFINSGVTKPVIVVQGGTDPNEFPYKGRSWVRGKEPYTFLTFADRGFRKGWEDVYESFYTAFGGKTSGVQDVRLIIKCRPTDWQKLWYMQLMANAKEIDKRLLFQVEDSPDMRDTYLQAHCVVIPSYSEGWGMPHREAASLGLPVITQRYSGLDDGCTEDWALVLDSGQLKPIPLEVNNIALGEWMKPDRASLVETMKACYEQPVAAWYRGRLASKWIHKYQTWEIAAGELVNAIKEEQFQVAGRPVPHHI